MPVKVGAIYGVAVDNLKITVFVAVGSGVFVLRGVGVDVSVGVDVGKCAAVCVDAAFAVCTMNVFTAPGSIVGNGVAAGKAGTHAMIMARIVNQKKMCPLCFSMISHTYVSLKVNFISLR